MTTCTCSFLTVNAYGLNGRGVRALELFHRMPSDFVRDVTHVCVLNACSHSGLVNEALSIFDGIVNKTEKIYTTMVTPRRSTGSRSCRTDLSFRCRSMA